MDSVRRIAWATICTALIGACLLIWGEARADTVAATPPTSTYGATAGTETAVIRFWPQDNGSTVGTPQASMAAACTAAVPIYNARAGNSWPWQSGGYTACGSCNVAPWGSGSCGSCRCVVLQGGTTPYDAGLTGPAFQAYWVWPSDNTSAGAASPSSSAPTRAAYTCPSGGTLTGTTCTVTGACPSGGYTLDSGGTTCSRPDCADGQVRDPSTGACGCSAGQFLSGASYSASGSYSTLDFCKGGCEYRATSKVKATSTDGTTRTHFLGPSVTTGDTCTAGVGGSGGEPPTAPPSGEPQTTEADCIAKGMSYGTVSGSVVCVPKGSGTPTETVKQDTTTTTNGSGTPTGSTTTTSTTNCTGGGCTTTSTTTTADGSGTTTETKTEKKPGDGTEMGKFCEENPSSPMCSSGTFNGSCGSFTCSGDGIQCAIAKKQHEDSCKWNELVLATGDYGTAAAVSSFDESRAFDKTTLTSAPVALETISGETFLSGGALTDYSVTLRGSSFTLPFAQLNVALQAIGLCFMAICGIMCYRIVARGVA